MHRNQTICDFLHRKRYAEFRKRDYRTITELLRRLFTKQKERFVIRSIKNIAQNLKFIRMIPKEKFQIKLENIFTYFRAHFSFKFLYLSDPGSRNIRKRYFILIFKFRRIPPSRIRKNYIDLESKTV